MQNTPTPDASTEHVMAFSETVLDTLVDTFTKLREKDRTEGEGGDLGALGGIGTMVEAAQAHGPTSATILLALAVRRLADR